MKRAVVCLSILASHVAWAGFDSDSKIRKVYDHWALKIFTPYQYKKKTTEIPEPLIAIHRESEGKRNEMRLIHHGAAALYKRLEMMDRATRSIEMEYFIFSPLKKSPAPTETPYELSTKIVTNKLIEKAVQGVRVRLLVDHSLTVFQFDDYYVTAAKERVRREGGNPDNFEVRYYNNKISQFRSHRKLLVIDDEEAITGGRNIDDKYFDLDHRYNFLDRDIWVKGSVVPVMRASFDAFWSANVTRHGKVLSSPRWEFRKGSNASAARMSSASDFMVYTDFDRDIERRSRDLGERLYATSETHTCPTTIYAADRPLDTVFARWCISDKVCKEGGYKETHRFTERAIAEQVAKLGADDELLVDSPYFLLNTRSGGLLKRLTENQVKITVHTNSLGSTDAVYVSSGWYREVFDLVDLGVKAYVHGARAEAGYPTIDENARKARWGTHSKTQIFGDKSFFVGTYNIDNRSSFYNAEMGIICDGSPELTADVTANFRSRLKNAGYRILGRDSALDAEGNSVDALGNANKKQRDLMELLRYPTEALQFLM